MICLLEAVSRPALGRSLPSAAGGSEVPCIRAGGKFVDMG
jgi:hypothetical protein